MKMTADSVTLSFHEDAPRPDMAFRKQWTGFLFDSVTIATPRSFDYSWHGESHYLALHDIVLSDGEIDLSGEARATQKDLRNRLTFAPKGVEVKGWSKILRPDQSYTAVVFEPDLAETEIERSFYGGDLRPLLYIENKRIAQTLGRIEALVRSNDSDNALLSETLGLLLILQMYPDFVQKNIDRSGTLSSEQQKRVTEYINSKMGSPISLTDLANAAGLSRFHFARSFTRTFGRSPYQHVLMSRMSRAATLLATSKLPIADISARLGFSSHARFSTAFGRITGQTPRQFRAACA